MNVHLFMAIHLLPYTKTSVKLQAQICTSSNGPFEHGHSERAPATNAFTIGHLLGGVSKSTVRGGAQVQMYC